MAHPVVNTPEKLKEIWDKIGAKWGEWMLQDDGRRLEQLFAESDLKTLGIFGGIMTEKVLLLSGQPTQIFGVQEHKKMEELAPALLAEIERRKQVKALAGQTEITVSK